MLLLKKTAQYWVPLLVVALAAGLILLNLQLSEQFLYQDELLPRWSAARGWMRDGTSPYSEQAYQEAQALYDQLGYTAPAFSQGRFIDLVWYVFLYIPFSFLPYPIARAIWMTLTTAAIFFSAWFGIDLAGARMRSLERVLLALLITCSYPFFKLILSASILPLFIFVLLAACRSALAGKGTSAGVLLFLCVGMLPVSLLPAVFLIIWLNARKQTDALPVFLVGLVFLALTSLILFPGWIPQWFTSLIAAQPRFDWLDTPLMRLAAFFPGAVVPLAAALHVLLLFAMLVEWYGLAENDERRFRWKLMLTLTLLSLFNPAGSPAFLILAWPGFLIFYDFLQEKWKISGKIIFWTILLLLLYSNWQVFLRTQNWSSKEATWVITALPIAALVCLGWTRWWAMSSPKPLRDA
ncbi:MAG TPA: glycosyltransferase family 87 protein [Anaerolineaceae bacterium]|nr:glycosyltransferase family 87 protein [Anaerolineaceae bacterium]